MLLGISWFIVAVCCWMIALFHSQRRFWFPSAIISVILLGVPGIIILKEHPVHATGVLAMAGVVVVDFIIRIRKGGGHVERQALGERRE